jgi:hypothetical protein
MNKITKKGRCAPEKARSCFIEIVERDMVLELSIDFTNNPIIKLPNEQLA